jgi:hypothetical protein
MQESTSQAHLGSLCNEANENKIKQAQGTPFMIPPLSDEVGWLGVGPPVCMMLDGTYETPEGVD